MRLSDQDRTGLFTQIVSSLPSAARGSILVDEDYCARFKAAPKSWFPLHRGADVDTESLHTVLGAAVAGRKIAKLTLRDGRHVRIKLGMTKSGQATIQFKEKRFAFAYANLLSTNPRKRTIVLKRIFENRPLTSGEENKWKTIALDHPFFEREYAELMTSLGSTPEGVQERLFRTETLGLDALMPASAEYYSRLAGRASASTTLDCYIGKELEQHRKDILTRHPKKALRRLAFSGLWQPLIPFNLLSSLTVADISTLLDAEDPFSLLFGFEICCKVIYIDKSAIETGSAFLRKLLLTPKRSRARCNIFSACAIISSLNLRRAGKAANEPLFWVRLAALTHAGVLADALRGISDTEGFLRWSVENWIASYLWHGAIDQRDAPRWKPDWISPEHLNAELIGRVQGAVEGVTADIRPQVWTALLDEAMRQMLETGNALWPYYPGPFDDFREVTPLSSDIEIFKEVEVKLAEAARFADAPGLVALANSVKPSTGVVANVVRLLSGPAGSALGDREIELPILQVCAHLAASTRSKEVAKLVINRCVFILRQSERIEAVSDLFLTATHACAACAEPQEYREFLGETAVQFCFGISDTNDLSNVDRILEAISLRDEKLVPALGRARAIAQVRISRN